MAISFDEALGTSPRALYLKEKRSEILATNLANADTPNYKARDLDFKAALKQSLDSGVGMKLTQGGHIASERQVAGADLMYRNPGQVSLDGNTVEPHVEQAKYSENAVQYEASLRFLGGHFAELMTAIRGE